MKNNFFLFHLVRIYFDNQNQKKMFFPQFILLPHVKQNERKTTHNRLSLA